MQANGGHALAEPSCPLVKMDELERALGDRIANYVRLYYMHFTTYKFVYQPMMLWDYTKRKSHQRKKK